MGIFAEDSGFRRRLNENVGREIRALRRELGIGKRSMAEKCLTSESTIDKIEAGVMACPLHLLVRIADELDTTLDALVPIMAGEDT